MRKPHRRDNSMGSLAGGGASMSSARPEALSEAAKLPKAEEAEGIWEPCDAGGR